MSPFYVSLCKFGMIGPPAGAGLLFNLSEALAWFSGVLSTLKQLCRSPGSLWDRGVDAQQLSAAMNWSPLEGTDFPISCQRRITAQEHTLERDVLPALKAHLEN